MVSDSWDGKSSMNQTSTIDAHRHTTIDPSISDALRDCHGILLCAHHSLEFIDFVDILNLIRPHEFCNVLYISLIRSYHYLKATLTQKPLENKKISIVDCVSGFTFPVEDRIDDCLYHKPPHDLEDMKDILEFGISKVHPDIVVFDSLSQFINFAQPSQEDLHALGNFLQSLRNELLTVEQKAVIFLYDDRLGASKHLINMPADMMIEVSPKSTSSSR